MYRIIDFLRALRGLVTGRKAVELIAKAYRLFHREGFLGFRRIIRDLFGISYEHWIRCYDTLSDEDRKLIVCHVESLSYRPLISVLMPVYNPPAEFLLQAIDSVRRQLYPHWELCIVDDASSLPHVRKILEDAARTDARVRVNFREKNGHISAASNTALEMARGEFIALLDHDDELADNALYLVVVALNENSTLDLLYSDEDKIDARGRRFGHYFKPDWNPDLFFCQNLISHLGVYRTSLAVKIGGFREGYEGSQDWDFALRFLDVTEYAKIKHIPYVLYHWRAIAGSTAVSVDAKSYAVGAAQRALEEYWQRKGAEVEVRRSDNGHFVTYFRVPSPAPTVSVLIPTRNHCELLRRCIEGICKRTNYPSIEIIVVDNNSDDLESQSYLQELQEKNIAHVLSYNGIFNYAAINNWAAQKASGHLLCLLNNDVEPIEPGWLLKMVGHALRPEVGAVGAKLLYPDGRIQHAGVLLDGVAARHFYCGWARNSAGYANRARLTQNYSAVTAACLVVRRQVWDEIGGMDAGNFPVAFNDVDFCLRVEQHGFRNLWVPDSELYHRESASRGKDNTPDRQARFQVEVARFGERWGSLLANDPAWNPNLELDGSRIRLATPPRVKWPWKHEGEKNQFM